jgi:hypothetical protein
MNSTPAVEQWQRDLSPLKAALAATRRNARTDKLGPGQSELVRHEF